MPIHLAKGGVAEGLAAMLCESARHMPVSTPTPEGVVEELTDDLSPLISLVLYLCSQAAEFRSAGGLNRRPTPPQPVKTKQGLRMFPPERPTRWEVGCRLGSALRRGMSERETEAGQSGTHASPRPHIRRAHWHSYWVGQSRRAGARSVVLKWLPPIAINVQDVEELISTVRDVGTDGDR